MAKLPDYLARLQKNARNKEYRLRKKGADPLRLAEISPRLSANEVARMDAREQRAYARRLQHFNARDNAVSVTDSGALLPTRVVRAIERERAAYNAAAQKRIERIEALTKGTRIPQRYGTVRERLAGRAVTHMGQRIGGSMAAGRVTEVRRPDLTSSKQAQRILSKLREMNRPTTDAKRRRLVKRSAVEMLNAMGETKLANTVRNMTAEQFDVLSTATNFWDMLEIDYDPEQFSRWAEANMSDKRYEDYSGRNADFLEQLRYNATTGDSGESVQYGNVSGIQDAVDLVGEYVPRVKNRRR